MWMWRIPTHSTFSPHSSQCTNVQQLYNVSDTYTVIPGDTYNHIDNVRTMTTITIVMVITTTKTATTTMMAMMMMMVVKLIMIILLCICEILHVYKHTSWGGGKEGVWVKARQIGAC